MTKAVPYYPFYAANVLASKPFRLMSAQERGLWITIQMECWVNGSVPSDPKELANYLGIPFEVVERSLTKIQYSFIEKIGNELTSPELDEQRNIFMERREKQRLGGIKGAKEKKAKQVPAKAIDEQGTPTGQPKGSLSYIKSNSINLNQLTRSEVLTKDQKAWADDFSNASANPNAYEKASRG